MTANVHVDPEGLDTVQESVEASVTAQTGVPETVRLAGTSSVMTALPDPSPTLEIVTV